MVFFFNDLAIIFTDALNNEEISYILLVPFIFAYMIYRKRKMLRVVMPDDIKEQPKKLKYVAPIAGILLFTTAILLYWHGTYTFTPLEYHLVSMPLFAAGLILLFFNLQTLRETIFPIIFLFFLAPPPTEILYTVGATLSSLSSEVSNALIGLAGIPSTLTNEYASPMIIITRANGAQLNFTVDVACSGIYSLLGFLMFAVLLAYIIRDRPWKKITLILTGILIVYLLNVVRITTILVMGYQFGENIALQAFHLLGGWLLIFLGTLLLLFTGEKILKTRFFDTKKKECKQCAINNQKQDFCFTCGRLLKHKGIANRSQHNCSCGHISVYSSTRIRNDPWSSRYTGKYTKRTNR
jgi:exosortase